jgi:hypothetical protein
MSGAPLVGWEARAEESALFATVGACVPSQVCRRRGLWETSLRLFWTETVLERCRKPHAVLETSTGFQAHVYCTGLPSTGLLSYVSRK